MLTIQKAHWLAFANLRKEPSVTVSDFFSTGSALVGLVMLLTLLFRLKKHLRQLAKQPGRSQ